VFRLSDRPNVTQPTAVLFSPDPSCIGATESVVLRQVHSLCQRYSFSPERKPLGQRVVSTKRGSSLQYRVPFSHHPFGRASPNFFFPFSASRSKQFYPAPPNLVCHLLSSHPSEFSGPFANKDLLFSTFFFVVEPTFKVDQFFQEFSAPPSMRSVSCHISATVFDKSEID